MYTQFLGAEVKVYTEPGTHSASSDLRWLVNFIGAARFFDLGECIRAVAKTCGMQELYEVWGHAPHLLSEKI